MYLGTRKYVNAMTSIHVHEYFRKYEYVRVETCTTIYEGVFGPFFQTQSSDDYFIIIVIK